MMRANLPFVSTTRFRDKHVLWMSSTASAGSGKSESTKSHTKHRHFLTSFGLLAHSIAYLAFTQGVTGIGVPHSLPESDDDSPNLEASAVVIPASSILELLHELVDSPTLGQFSHEPGSTRTAPHLLFGLDVSKVVGNILRAEESRWGTPRLDADDLSEGWDLLDQVDGGD